MLDVTRLRVLTAIARHGSVSAAARALGYAQPSISHHLARLEAETGAKLVQRVGRGIRLTDAGRLLAERAEEILGRMDVAEAELDAISGLRAGRVRLAAFPSALGTFVPSAFAAFAGAHPGVDLVLAEAEPPEAARLLRSGEVDVALLFSYPDDPATDDDLRRTPLLTEPTYLVVPADESAGRTADQPGGRLADYADRRWIAGCERCRTHLLRTCSLAGFTPDIAYTTDDYVAVQALVAAGLGVTTLPGLALAAQRNPAVRTVVLPGHERLVSAAVHGDPPDTPATAALLAELVRFAALPLDS